MCFYWSCMLLLEPPSIMCSCTNKYALRLEVYIFVSLDCVLSILHGSFFLHLVCNHYCSILTFTRWLLFRPLSIGLAHPFWWPNQWVAFVTLVVNLLIVFNSIKTDSTMMKLLWSTTFNSCGIGKWQGMGQWIQYTFEGLSGKRG